MPLTLGQIRDTISKMCPHAQTHLPQCYLASHVNTVKLLLSIFSIILSSFDYYLSSLGPDLLTCLCLRTTIPGALN